MNNYNPTAEEVDQMIADLQRQIDILEPGEPEPVICIYKKDPDVYEPDVFSTNVYYDDVLIEEGGQFISKGNLISEGKEYRSAFTLSDLITLQKN